MQDLDLNELVNDVVAATYLKTTRQTLANWRSTKRHNLPYVKIGSLVRYKRQDLKQFVEEQTVVAKVHKLSEQIQPGKAAKGRAQ